MELLGCAGGFLLLPWAEVLGELNQKLGDMEEQKYVWLYAEMVVLPTNFSAFIYSIGSRLLRKRKKKKKK